ncbi:hypothetical protein SAMN05421736_13418 [Evansella caseinilytica]|uniref:Transposase n=1 Tax=Evansella caseinilytica TaxID=1503961 RepID=A0A1H3V2E1_9BACI|nr:hypothetical protein SAMN05421736_13418 [Evansella caseinilytica]
MKKYRRANVVIPNIHPSHFSNQLRRENQRLIKRLERLERGLYGMRKRSKKEN